MPTVLQTQLDRALSALTKGGVIAYPTEFVYGLGCDPQNQTAVSRLLALKKRPMKKGLILIAATFAELSPYIGLVPQKRLKIITARWPGPITWLFPASTCAPPWIVGQHATVAVRVTAHPVVRALCTAFQKPLVSTSANLTGAPPVRDSHALCHLPFSKQLDAIITAQVGSHEKHATPIYDALSGNAVRVA